MARINSVTRLVDWLDDEAPPLSLEQQAQYRREAKVGCWYALAALGIYILVTYGWQWWPSSRDAVTVFCLVLVGAILVRPCLERRP